MKIVSYQLMYCILIKTDLFQDTQGQKIQRGVATNCFTLIRISAPVVEDVRKFALLTASQSKRLLGALSVPAISKKLKVGND